MDYKEIADQIIIAIGGQDNVKYVTHCVTRLRFEFTLRRISCIKKY